jgi:2',3'-cyclic-nucleotide 2'-phosphodiesterase (5'-nucleotidase family)
MNRHFLKYIFFIVSLSGILACTTPAHISERKTSMVAVNEQTHPAQDSAMLQDIVPYKSKLDAVMNEVLVQSDEAMVKGTPESNLSNLLCDLTIKKTNDKLQAADGMIAQICVMNSGGIRTTIPKGAVTRGRIFEVMPFENEIVVLTLSGEKTAELLDFIAKKGGAPVGGVRFGIRDAKAVNIIVNGEAFDIKKNYTICTSDYLANGGDNITCFANPVKRVNLSYKLRDAIIDYCVEVNKAGKTLNNKADGRIYFEK